LVGRQARAKHKCQLKGGILNQTAFLALVQAIYELQEIASGLYDTSSVVSEQGALSDATLLQTVADKLYREGENIDVLLVEMEA
jgi:hypothetical protein